MNMCKLCSVVFSHTARALQTLLERIKTKYGTTQGLPPEKIPPTIGMNLAKIKYKGNQIVFWDLGGQTKMRKVWESYYKEANAVIFVVDSADSGRYQDAREAFASACANDILAHTPVVFIANKMDLPQARSPHELVVEIVGTGSGALLLKGGVPPSVGTSALTS